MSRGHAGQEGFTLLEMLVALALAGLLAATMTGMLRTSTRVWDRGVRVTTRTEALVRLDRTLRRELATLVPAGALGTVAGSPPLFFGAPDGFGWVARTPSEAMGPGLYGERVRLDQGKGLILESWPIDRPNEITTAPLGMPGVGVAFAYFGTRPPDAVPRWTTRWPAGPIPPRLVRIRIGDEARDLVYAVG